MSIIINIEDSPLRNRRFRIFFLNGKHYDIGFKKCQYYIDHHDKLRRELYYTVFNESSKIAIMSLKPSQLLYDTFILNGYSKNIINNINFFNKEIIGEY
jgi:hypothetical protein